MQFEPVKCDRFFTKEKLYSEVSWSDFNSVVAAFEDRIRNWYFDPATVLKNANGHYAFSIMAIDCLLIDTFSQFFAGKCESSRSTFTGFIQSYLGRFNSSLVSPITYSYRGKSKYLVTVADVIYAGFRCGILHQAHIPLFGAVDPGGAPFRDVPTGLTLYSTSGSPCPTVVINPLELLSDLEDLFSQYVKDLQNPSCGFDELRRRFKLKFTDGFGVII